MLLVSIASFMSSFALVWPSYTIALLENDSTPLNYKITKQDEAFIGSFPMLGSFIMSFIVGYMSDRIGRKKSEILCGLFYTLSWAITTTAKVPMQILIGRLLFGFGMGIHFIVGLIYTGEMAHQSIRGAATSILMFAFNTGAMVSYIAGWFCSYQFICYFNLSTGVLFVVLMCMMRETPAFLIAQGNDKEALSSLRFYRAASTTTEDIMEEFSYIKSQRMNNKNDSNLEKSQKDTENENLNKENGITKEKKEMNPWKLLWTSKAAQRQVISFTIVVVLTNFMGMMGVQAYAGKFFAMAAPDISPHLCSVLLALVMTVASGVSASITDLFDRRVLMICSTSLSTVSLALVGVQLRWSFGPEWIIPLLVVAYCTTFQIGANNIPLVQATESYGPEIRGLGMQIIMCMICMSNFILLLLFGPAVQCIGLDGTFFVFALIGAIVTVVVVLSMKETRHVPLEAIHNMFEDGYLYRKTEK